MPGITQLGSYRVRIQVLFCVTPNFVLLSLGHSAASCAIGDPVHLSQEEGHLNLILGHRVLAVGGGLVLEYCPAQSPDEYRIPKAGGN